MRISSAGGTSPPPSYLTPRQNLSRSFFPSFFLACREEWRLLCERGGCTPRHDAGCTKPGASGVCSSFDGCVQRNFETLPPRINQRGREARGEDFMFLDILEPAPGQRFPRGQSVHVRFEVEVLVHRERAKQIEREVRHSASYSSLFLPLPPLHPLSLFRPILAYLATLLLFPPSSLLALPASFPPSPPLPIPSPIPTLSIRRAQPSISST